MLEIQDVAHAYLMNSLRTKRCAIAMGMNILKNKINGGFRLHCEIFENVWLIIRSISKEFSSYLQHSAESFG